MSAENPNPFLEQTVRVSKASTVFSGFTTVISKNSNRSNADYASLYDGPIPVLREQIQSTFTCYVEMHRSNRNKHAQLTPTIFIKNVLAMLLSVDKQVAILCYDPDKTYNSICHPVHVPSTPLEFSHYFPRVYTARGTITVKCRITSSESMVKLKKQLLEKLRKHNYYLRPSLLRAVRTGKAGWFYLAHPDLTHRAEFTKVLPPFIRARFKKYIEFQVSPEVESVDLEGKKTSQRVLVVRCPYEEVENIRMMFTEIFSAHSQTNIGFLARYTFVPSHPVGSCTKSHLSTLLTMQQHFHKNVYWFNLIGVQNMDSVQKRLPVPSTEPSTTNPSTESSSSPPDDDTPMESSNDNPEEEPFPSAQSEASQSQETSTDPSARFSSLRLILYHLENHQGHNLIHAAYPSADSTKVYVLCSESNKSEVLYQLQHIYEIVQQNFVTSSLSTYFTTKDNTRPYVLNHPLLSDEGEKFVNSLVDLTSLENPQDPSQTHQRPPSTQKPSFASVISPSPHKRQRSGTPKTTTSNNLPIGFATLHDNDDTITSSLQETTSRLHHLEQSNSDTQASLVNMSKRLDQQGEEINLLGESLVHTNNKVDKISETQISQGNTMCQMNSSLSSILAELSKLTKLGNIQSKQAEPPHGTGVEEK